jgi:hypothetical protein
MQRLIVIQASLEKKVRPYLEKITKAKLAGGMA